jgi:predicted transcriptional regulator
MEIHILQIVEWKHSQIDQLVYFSRLNYKYLKIYHEIIKHVIWLGGKVG